MGSVKEYFSSLGTGIASLVKGLTVTGKEFVTPKITECYPENRDQGVAAERFRAELHFVYNEDGTHRCICCSACERACPNGTIRIEPKMVTTATGAKKKKLAKYFYDLGSCTFLPVVRYKLSHTGYCFRQRFRAGCFLPGKTCEAAQQPSRARRTGTNS